MRVTRRFLAVAGAGAFLALLAWALARPQLLIGVAGIGAWLLAQQYAFLTAVTETTQTLRVEQAVTPERPLTEDPVTLSMGVEDFPATLSATVEARPPVAMTGADRSELTIGLDHESKSGQTVATLTTPVAGSFQFGQARVRLSDRFGLFEDRFDVGPSPGVTVQPRTPRNIHVGEGGEAIATPFGTHPAGRGSGLEPAELRKYVPGDSARQIDWNATARLGEAFVREFEAETDRETAILLDARASMTEGIEGERKLDFARQVALGVVAAAERAGDPLGLYTIGDAGIRHRLEPSTISDRYPAVRELLLGLGSIDAGRDADGDGTHRGVIGFGDSISASPAVARKKAGRLAETGAEFARLGPFLESASVYVERLAGDSLFETARQEIAAHRGQTLAIILTDDRDRVGLRETVELLSRHDDQVLVFLTPSVLFEPGGLGDLERAFEAYVDFESYRRDLHSLPRVTAREVAPGDRLQAVLGSARAGQLASNGAANRSNGLTRSPNGGRPE